MLSIFLFIVSHRNVTDFRKNNASIQYTGVAEAETLETDDVGSNPYSIWLCDTESYLTSLYLNVLIFKMRKIVIFYNTYHVRWLGKLTALEQLSP